MQIPYISNDLKIDNGISTYCAILGESPSKGARSPILWNECFKEMGISSFFYPFDVGLNDLDKVVDYLKNDIKFVGGAIAVPHKEAIIDYLDEIEGETALIGAVNLLYRKNGKLWFVWCFE